MVGSLLISVLFLQAPGEVDAEKALRVAWASQYEWKEDDVKSVALDFTWSTSWKGKDGKETRTQGYGHLLVVGDKVVRRHHPGVTADRSRQADRYLDWILERFMRQSFDERFKDQKIEAGEKTEDGALRIKVGGRVLLVKGDRLVGEEWVQVEDDKRFPVSTKYTTADMGGGYGVVGRQYEYVREAGKTENTVLLELQKNSPIPAPSEYREVSVWPGSRWEVRIIFDQPRFDVEHAVVLEPATRDLLKEAWATRYTLPNDIRIEAKFEREVDKGLAKAGWRKQVEGEMQVWGMDQITTALDEDTVRRRRWVDQLKGTVDLHFQEFFTGVRTRPFDEEFANCGFRRGAESKEGIEIEVIGHRRARGFRVKEGRVVGHLALVAPADGWFEHKLKKAKDGRFLIDKMTRCVEKQKFTLDFTWARSKGCHVPKRFSVFIEPGSDQNGNPTVFGVVEYALIKTQVSFP